MDLADAVEPGLTVIAQDAHELGRLAAARLFARLTATAARAGGKSCRRR